MTTVANSKNSFHKRLEIFQMGSSASQCTLSTEFLKKPENYTLQLERAVINTTPQINTVTGTYMQILARPGANVVGHVDGVVDVLYGDFEPENPKSRRRDRTD